MSRLRSIPSSAVGLSLAMTLTASRAVRFALISPLSCNKIRRFFIRNRWLYVEDEEETSHGHHVVIGGNLQDEILSTKGAIYDALYFSALSLRSIEVPASGFVLESVIYLFLWAHEECSLWKMSLVFPYIFYILPLIFIAFGRMDSSRSRLRQLARTLPGFCLHKEFP